MTRRGLGWAMLAAAFSAGAPPGIARAGRESHATWAREFPALAQRIDGRPLVYLDSAATTQRPTAVIDALADFYRQDNANPGATLHALARRASDRYEQARRTLATFLNASTPAEVVWVRGTTEGVNLVADAWARRRLRAGDEILLTVAEHASNLLPWRMAAAQSGAVVRYVDVDDEGRISLPDLERKLSRRTRLLAFSHVSNVAGYVNPAAQICALARNAGARVFVDAAQSAPHVALDVQAMGCDFLAFSGHKMLGPMGVGVLWARAELLEEMSPYQSGSNMAHEVDLDGEQIEHGARKFGAGTPNVAGAVGLAAAVSFAQSLGAEEVRRHEATLTEHALARLAGIGGLRVIGPTDAEQRIPVFTFVLDGWQPAQVLRKLDERGIAIRAGDLSALPLLRHFGLTQAARASCYFYNRTQDIDALAAVLQELAGQRT